MWQPVVFGEYLVKRIFVCPDGIWVVGRDGAFFLHNEEKQRAAVVCEYGHGWMTLGTVENALFLCDPDNSTVVAYQPDGSRKRVVVATGGLLPSAVSCYSYDFLSPTKIRVDGIGKDVYVYCSPPGTGMAVGSNLAVIWNRSEKYAWVHRREDGPSSSRSIVLVERFAHIDNVVVGAEIIRIENVRALVFAPYQPSGVCKLDVYHSAIEENTNRIVVYKQGQKAVFCWEWKKPRYGVISVPRDASVHEIFVGGGRVFACGWINNKRGIFSAPFPEMNVEGAFPYYRESLWANQEEL